MTTEETWLDNTITAFAKIYDNRIQTATDAGLTTETVGSALMSISIVVIAKQLRFIPRDKRPAIMATLTDVALEGARTVEEGIGLAELLHRVCKVEEVRGGSK